MGRWRCLREEQHFADRSHELTVRSALMPHGSESARGEQAWVPRRKMDLMEWVRFHRNSLELGCRLSR